ncbi:MAG: glycosyltransferase [Verrucomicrobia bacterium]|nr:glycosyltransferase [Verrucomicrobiota bacterium]
MRVALVISALARGGAERQLIQLAIGLSNLGEEVQVWCYGGASEIDDELREAGVLVRNSEGSRASKFRVLRQWIRKFNPHVLHGFMKRASALLLLSRGARFHPVVIASDLSTATYGKRDLTLWLSLALFVLAQRVATQTDLNRRSLERLAPWLRGKIRVVRNGLDLGRYEPASDPANATPFRFLAVGSVYGVKNPVRAVEAVAIMRDQGRSDFVLDWYGRLGLKGDDDPSAEYLECRDKIESLGLCEYIRFHGESSQISVAYQKSNALIHPSLQEGFPNAVVEGMACGLPMVVSRVSDLPLVVREAQNGFVFNETDSKDIASAMAAMMDTPASERAAMGRRSRHLAEKWFGLDRFVSEYQALYAELLQAR